MRSVITGSVALVWLLIGLSGTNLAATFGSIVQIQGQVADIALDQGRGVVYAANFTANRIEVVSTSNLSLQSPMVVAAPPSTVALSPDGRYLVVGHYDNVYVPSQAPNAPQNPLPNPPCNPQDTTLRVLTVIDLVNGGKQTRLDSGGACVLAVAFGNSPKALVVSTDGVRLLDPASGTLTLLNMTGFLSEPLPVPWATYPPSILKASAGTSGDGNVIYALVDASAPSWQALHPYAVGYEILDSAQHLQEVVVAGISGPAQPTWNDTGGYTTDGTVTWQDQGPAPSIVIRYETSTGKLILVGQVTAPRLGPRVVTVNQDGSRFLAGWILYDVNLDDLAQFPYPPGVYNQGSLAFDWSRNLIYAQVAAGTIQATLGSPPSAGPSSSAPLLHIADSDNLTIEGIYQLRENLGGKSLLTSDFQAMYAISDSGLTVFPMGSLQSVHRVQAAQEDLVFSASANANASACAQGAHGGVITQYVDIVDPGGGQTDFTLSTATPGISISPSSGTTPAHVAITVDMTAFAAQNGTTAVPLKISSVQAVNVPFPVRLLINTRNPSQQGTIYDAPGTIVDVLADPVRNRFYLIRQDKNLVLVFDATTFQQLASMRTGNTPVQMAITQDNNYLAVTNDNSQLVSVFDLNALQPLPPIFFPGYPRSIAVSNAGMLVTSRGFPPYTPVLSVQQIVFPKGVGTVTPADTGIYQNAVTSTGAVLAASPSGNVVFMAVPDGTVALYEAQTNTFVASRHDLSALSGAYAALSDNLFAADVNVLNGALVPIGQVNDGGNLSSGVSTAQSQGLFVSAPKGSPAGVIERFDLAQLTAINPVQTAEAPLIASAATTAPIGQIGQTILPFSRALAPLPNKQSIVFLSTSGFTVLPWTYEVSTVSTATPPVVAAVESAADGSPAVAPGGLIAIYGTLLSASSQSAGQVPLPTILANTCVSVNNELIPLLYVSPTQIDAQLPFDVSGNGSMVVQTSGGISSPFNFNIFSAAPTIFRTGTAGPMTGLPDVFRANDNYSLVTLSNPIRPRDILVIYATGLGLTSPQPAAGDAAPFSPLAVATEVPVVTIGSVALNLLYAGLVPGEVGVYQINVEVPYWISGALQVPLTVTQGGQSTTLQVRVVTP